MCVCVCVWVCVCGCLCVCVCVCGCVVCLCYSFIVLPQVIAQYNATALLTQRELVSKTIRESLERRARDFNLVMVRACAASRDVR